VVSRDKPRSSILTGYLDDIWSQPEEFESAFDRTAASLTDALTPGVCASWTDVVITGCGDSYCAGVSAAMAFEQFAGIRTRSVPSMQLSRYETALPMTGTAVIAISVSGETTRTVEGALLAHAAGAVTLGVSANPGSRLAQNTDLFVASRVPPAEVHGPDARTYMSSLLVLLLAAIQLGQSRGHLDDAAAAAARSSLRATADLMRDTLQNCGPAAQRTAAVLVKEGFGGFVAVGAGPGFGGALFAAAKIIEASGTHAWGQDGEEWAHIEYWLADTAMPTILLAVPGRAYDRLGEQLMAMNRIGRRAIVIAPTGDPLLAETPLRLPVSPVPEEAFTPLVFALAVELLSYYLVKEALLPAYAVTRDDDRAGPSNGIRTALASDKGELPGHATADTGWAPS
jgi:glucosamine--fructose-6-phosphate aminotransferase (isomerizing)